MPKWEYCAVAGIARRTRELVAAYPVIWYFTAEGCIKEEIRGDERQGLAQAIAALGDDGWEMVSAATGMGSGDTMLYFKRSIRSSCS